MNSKLSKFLISCVCFITLISCVSEKEATDYKIEQKIAKIMTQLSLEEKVSLCHGISGFEVGGIDRLSIPKIKMTDGPQGVRGPTSTYFPTGIAMASSWDPKLIQLLGSALGRETKAAGCKVLLGPGINIMRTPLNGRNFEYFGEDPLLAGKIAAGYISGVQSEGVAACVKHLSNNNQEKWRTTNSSEVDERTLRETYLSAFKIACDEGNVWAIMSAYNKVNGIYSSANKQIQYDIPKTDWGWDGAIISDWGGTHETEGAVNGGLDIEMPGGERNYLGKPYLEGLKSGKYDLKTLDDKVKRVLRLIYRTTIDSTLNKGEANTVAHQNIARKAAQESIVLLKNEDNILPINVAKIKSIAVIGPNANMQHSMDGVRGSGGSGSVNPPYEVTPLQGLKNSLGDKVTINFAEGISFKSNAEVIPAAHLFIDYTAKKQGIKATYFDSVNLTGKEILSREETTLNHIWTNQVLTEKISPKTFSARWTTTLVPHKTGRYKIGVESDDGSRLFINNQLVVNNWREQGMHVESEEYYFEKDKTYDIKVEYFQAGGEAGIKLIWEFLDNNSNKLDEALKIAKEADIVLFFGGTNHTYDTESLGWGDVSGADRPDLELIGNQKELIKQLTEVNPNVVVVLIGGGPLSVETWIDKVKGVFMAWYPGQEGGNAIADLLLGKVNPSAKLPCTFGKKLNDYACHSNGNYPGTGNNGIVNYDEGIFVGYRWFEKESIKPRFPFGYGLSYTDFELSKLGLSQGKNRKLTINVTIKNSGKIDGAEVIQLYVSDKESSLPRPLKELKGFQKVKLKSGEKQTIEMTLNEADFSFYNPEKGAWVFEPGEFEISLGVSSEDIRLKTDIEIN